MAVIKKLRKAAASPRFDRIFLNILIQISKYILKHI